MAYRFPAASTRWMTGPRGRSKRSPEWTSDPTKYLLLIVIAGLGDEASLFVSVEISHVDNSCNLCKNTTMIAGTIYKTSQ